MQTWTQIDGSGFHALIGYDRDHYVVYFKCGKIQQDTALRLMSIHEGVPGLWATGGSFRNYCPKCIGLPVLPDYTELIPSCET